MAFYDCSAEHKILSPLQQALLLPPDAILRHQDLLTSISKTANFSDEKSEYILDILLKNMRESLSYNTPSTSTTSLIILDFCIRNGTIFAQYVFGRYVLQKLYSLCCRDLTKVTSNHKQHQEFQYKLIGSILTWHQMFNNVSGATLNYTFSRLKNSGILALYQSYKQTQQLFDNNSPANSQQNMVPNLPASPLPKTNQIDEKDIHQQVPSFESRDRATTDPTSKAQQPNEPRPRSQSAEKGRNNAGKPDNAEKNGLNVAALLHRDGRIKLEYTEKFQNEVNELIVRYLKPTREILSSQKINLADKKLQKYLEILQVIQQRLVKVISEVKTEESVVSLAIKANDCIVTSILWFNALVKKSKQSKNKNEAVKADKTSSVSKNVMENIDLVGLEQQLLLDNANLFKRKQLRDLKEQKQKQEEEKEVQEKQATQSSEPVIVENNADLNANISQQVQEAVDLISDIPVANVAIDKEEKSPIAPVIISEQNVEIEVVTESDKVTDASKSFSSVVLKNNNDKESGNVVDLLNLNVAGNDIVNKSDEQKEAAMDCVDSDNDDVEDGQDIVPAIPKEAVQQVQNVAQNVEINVIADRL